MRWDRLDLDFCRIFEKQQKKSIKVLKSLSLTMDDLQQRRILVKIKGVFARAWLCKAEEKYLPMLFLMRD